MPAPLPAPLRPLAARPEAAAVLLDFDGTLAPIVARPGDARLLDGAREAVAALRDRYALVGFISGRGLADVAARVDLPGLAFAGNHGMELRAPGGAARVADEVVPHLSAVRAFARRLLGDAVLAQAGVRLEDKGATLSLHYRTAPDPEAARTLLHERVAPVAEAAGLRTSDGRMVLEVRPPAAVDKGTAVRALLAGAGVRTACFVGDDRTDADAWRALRALVAEGALDTGVAVVAESAELDPAVRAEADLAVAGPAGALALVRALVAAAGGARGGAAH